MPATQPFDFDVYIKGPLTVGSDLTTDTIKATLHLEQPAGETKELARFERSDGIGLKFDLAAGVPNLQGFRTNGAAGPLALNQAGGALRLGGTNSPVSVQDSLSVAGDLHLARKLFVHRDGAEMEVDLLQQPLEGHLANKHNPHCVTAAQVGALPIGGGELSGALTVQGDLVVNGRKLADDRGKLDEHLANRNNPHGVTAQQVGALPLAGGALTGPVSLQSDLTVTCTVNGRKLADDGTKLDNHVMSKTNPHDVTADQIGAVTSIGGVRNPGGNINLVGSNTITITPDATKKQLTIGESHSAITGNPHKTTAAQVGALPIGGGLLNGNLTIKDTSKDTSAFSEEGDYGARAIEIEAVSKSSGDAYGIYGAARNDGAGDATGIRIDAAGSSNGTKYGIYAAVHGPGTCYAGFFQGNVHVTGRLTKAQGQFLIDHPLDPLNKILRHNFVESPENLCLYRGKVTLDGLGQALVNLPAYFAALTKEEGATVMLTPEGRQPFSASYAWNTSFTAFMIFGEARAVVSYLVLADRDDPVCQQLAQPVEEEKGQGEFVKGRLLYPEAYGYPKELGMYGQLQSAKEGNDGDSTI